MNTITMCQHTVGHHQLAASSKVVDNLEVAVRHHKAVAHSILTTDRAFYVTLSDNGARRRGLLIKVFHTTLHNFQSRYYFRSSHIYIVCDIQALEVDIFGSEVVSTLDPYMTHYTSIAHSTLLVGLESSTIHLHTLVDILLRRKSTRAQHLWYIPSVLRLHTHCGMSHIHRTPLLYLRR